MCPAPHVSWARAHLAGQHIKGCVHPAAPGTIQRACPRRLAEPSVGLVALQAPQQITAIPHPACRPLPCIGQSLAVGGAVLRYQAGTARIGKSRERISASTRCDLRAAWRKGMHFPGVRVWAAGEMQHAHLLWLWHWRYAELEHPRLVNTQEHPVPCAPSLLRCP